MSFPAGSHVHIVGIGGFGMSAIARVLLERGYRVSGSDRGSNALTVQLAQAGATVYQGHDAAHIAGAAALFISSAISPANPEVAAAQAAGIPIFKRSDMLAALLNGQRTLAVAGTHGKTTTTAMLAHLLRETGHDPSYIVGGIMTNTGDNAHHGRDDLFVIEADEYDNMFHGLRPHTAIVTSLEYDHPDFFPTLEAMTQSFEHFVQQIVPDGTLVVLDDVSTTPLMRGGAARLVTYGCARGAFRVQNVRYMGDRMQFDVSQAGHVRTTAALHVYGLHNALNALAAALAAQTAGVPLARGLAALATFRGTGRRFEVRGEAHGVVVVDDYAHHPTAIRMTLEAARQRYPAHALWAVWQPHTYSRTLQLLDDYARAFDEADHVRVTDIYPSREPFTDAIHSRDVVTRMQHRDARVSGTLDATADLLLAEVSAPAVVLIMSAGDAPRIGVRLLHGLEARSV